MCIVIFRHIIQSQKLMTSDLFLFILFQMDNIIVVIFRSKDEHFLSWYIYTEDSLAAMRGKIDGRWHDAIRWTKESKNIETSLWHYQRSNGFTSQRHCME